MINKKYVVKIEEIAKAYFDKSEGVHDWTHVERVRKMALKIGGDEGADLFVLELASLLHDIGRCEESVNMNKKCHAETSAEWAKEILRNFEIEKAQLENILHCIVSHRFRNSHVPETLEAKCLFDADKLDAIGAVGIARDFLFAGYYTTTKLYTGNEKKYAESGIDYSYTEEDTGVLEWEVKLKHLKDKMLTKTGRKIALKRHKYMEEYFEKFWREVEGIE